MPSPMPDFEFLALGTPTLRHAGASRPLPAERLTQLLAVLALRQGWVTRESLLALLWPEFPAAAARRNLRKLLFKLRQVPGLPPVEADGDALRWRVATDHQQFERALQAAQWAEAVERARAPLLDGLECGAAGSFCEWLTFERARVSASRAQAASRCLEELAAQPEARTTLAGGWLDRDPLDEEALLALHHALLELGRAADAEHARQGYIARLQRLLGQEASARVLTLGLAAPPVARRPDPPRDHDLVGRRSEMRTLLEWLERPDCRLITLVGPGGVGKSRLARALSLIAPPQRPVLAWVALEDLTCVEQLPPRLAAALG